jgi:cyclase
MPVERIADDVWVFKSPTYAQVTASLITTRAGSILIDTLPFPSETRDIQLFLRRRGLAPIQYVINTHFHPDHSNGNYLFPEARLIASEECRLRLDKEGRGGIDQAREENAQLKDVQIRLPDVTVDIDGGLHLGGKNLRLFATPGHSADMLSVQLDEDKILFAGDAVMPVPYIVGGDLEASKASLQVIRGLNLENLVQGHGEVLLRGEIPELIDASIKYLDVLRARVQRALDMGMSRDDLRGIDIEECGISRVPLSGLVQRLHEANVGYLYDTLKRSTGSTSAEPKPAEDGEADAEGNEEH